MKLFSASFLKQAIAYVFTLFEGFMALRVVLKLLAANPNAPFVKWVYGTTHPLVAPFLGMFPSQFEGSTIEIEFSTIFGMLMYSLAGFALIQLVNIVERGGR